MVTYQGRFHRRTKSEKKQVLVKQNKFETPLIGKTKRLHPTEKFSHTCEPGRTEVDERCLHTPMNISPLRSLSIEPRTDSSTLEVENGRPSDQ